MVMVGTKCTPVSSNLGTNSRVVEVQLMNSAVSRETYDALKIRLNA